MKTVDAYKVDRGSKVLLNANESYKNLPKHIIEEIKEGIEEVLFNRYPDSSADLLTKTYAKAFNVSEDNVMFGNGSDEMLGLIIGLNIKEGRKLYTLNPDFSMYDYYTSFHQGNVLKYSIDNFDVDKFIQNGNHNGSKYGRNYNSPKKIF